MTSLSLHELALFDCSGIIVYNKNLAFFIFWSPKEHRKENEFEKVFRSILISERCNLALILKRKVRENIVDRFYFGPSRLNNCSNFLQPMKMSTKLLQPCCVQTKLHFQEKGFHQYPEKMSLRRKVFFHPQGRNGCEVFLAWLHILNDFPSVDGNKKNLPELLVWLGIVEKFHEKTNIKNFWQRIVQCDNIVLTYK